jgi:hypothetical protein
MSIRNKAKKASNMREEIEKRKSEGGKKKGGDKRFLNYYDMKVGEKLTVRFLPDPETGEYWAEYATHGPNLKLRGLDGISCAYTSSGEECPACTHSFDYYNDGDKTQAQRWRRKETYIGQVLVMDEEPMIEVNETEDGNPVKLLYIPWGVIEVMQEAIMEERIGEIIDHDFIIKKTEKKGGQANYDKSYFKETEDILPDEVLDAFDEGEFTLHDLSKELPAPSTTEDVDEWLEKAIELDEKTSRRRKSSTPARGRKSHDPDADEEEDDDKPARSRKAARDDDDEPAPTKKVGKSSLMERLEKKKKEAEA